MSPETLWKVRRSMAFPGASVLVLPPTPGLDIYLFAPLIKPDHGMTHPATQMGRRSLAKITHMS